MKAKKKTKCSLAKEEPTGAPKRKEKKKRKGKTESAAETKKKAHVESSEFPKRGRKVIAQSEEMKKLVESLGQLLGCPKCSWNDRIGCKQCRNPKYKPRSKRPDP